jgi:hypothetical protein
MPPLGGFLFDQMRQVMAKIKNTPKTVNPTIFRELCLLCASGRMSLAPI